MTSKLRLFILAIVMAISTSAMAQQEAKDAEQPAEAQPAAPALPQVVNLRPQFVEGQAARYSLWSLRDEVVTMQMGEREQEFTSRVEVDGEMSWKVERVHPGGGATCVMTMHWMSAAMTLPDGSVQQSDTRRGPGDSERMHQLMTAMIDTPLRVEVAADGSIISVAGTDQMRQRAPQDITLPDDLDFMESASELATLPFAPQQLSVGGTWPSQFTWLHEAGKLHYQTQSTLQSVEMIAGIPLATVTSRSTIRLEPDMSKLPPGSPPVQVRLLRGEATKQVLFDLSRNEAAGRNTVETRDFEVRVQLQDQTMIRNTSETLRTQTLRIAEQ